MIRKISFLEHLQGTKILKFYAPAIKPHHYQFSLSLFQLCSSQRVEYSLLYSHLHHLSFVTK